LAAFEERYVTSSSSALAVTYRGMTRTTRTASQKMPLAGLKASLVMLAGPFAGIALLLIVKTGKLY